MTTMTQCRLERNGSYQVSWIETKYAKKGRVVNLKEGDEWDRGWTVMIVGSTLPAETVMARQRDYKNHRKATDV